MHIVKCMCLMFSSSSNSVAVHTVAVHSNAGVVQLKQEKASRSYTGDSNGVLPQAPYNADFNCLSLHHLSYQSWQILITCTLLIHMYIY